ncbi:MAG: hypothetical protein P4M14_04750 [Gammaproteobacteria bacterium]|nr:hypothetical protein [Gammaproteobacteria bacterium]
MCFKGSKSKAFLAAMLAFCFSSLAEAKVISLYDQPKPDAKVVATLDSSNGMVPIFTPKNSDWMKIGNPQNGDVGWIKLEDLTNESGSLATQFSMTQKTVNTKNGPKTIQVVEFSTPKTMTSAQNQALIKEIQSRQDNLQKSVQKLMQSFSQDMNSYYMENPAMFSTPNMPIVMPILVYPQDAPPSSNAPHSSQLKVNTLPKS